MKVELSKEEIKIILSMMGAIVSEWNYLTGDEEELKDKLEKVLKEA